MATQMTKDGHGGAQWSLVTGDSGDPIRFPAGMSLGAALQAVGTWGGGTLTIEVSNDGATFFPLTTLDGSAAPTLSADGVIEVSTGAKFIRPSFAGGSGGAIDVLLFARG